MESIYQRSLKLGKYVHKYVQSNMFARWQFGYMHYLKYGLGFIVAKYDGTTLKFIGYVPITDINRYFLHKEPRDSIANGISTSDPTVSQFTIFSANNEIMFCEHQRNSYLANCIDSNLIAEIDEDFLKFAQFFRVQNNVTKAPKQDSALWYFYNFGNPVVSLCYAAYRYGRETNISLESIFSNDTFKYIGDRSMLEHTVNYHGMPTQTEEEKKTMVSKIKRIVQKKKSLVKLYVVQSLPQDLIDFAQEQDFAIYRGVLAPDMRDDVKYPAFWCPFVGPRSLGCQCFKCIVDAEYAKDPLMQCSCREAFYCSRQCQVDDWSKHKQTCTARNKKN